MEALFRENVARILAWLYNSVFPKDLLTFECANGVMKDAGLFRVTPLRGHTFPAEVPAWPGSEPGLLVL